MIGTDNSATRDHRKPIQNIPNTKTIPCTHLKNCTKFGFSSHLNAIIILVRYLLDQPQPPIQSNPTNPTNPTNQAARLAIGFSFCFLVPFSKCPGFSVNSTNSTTQLESRPSLCTFVTLFSKHCSRCFIESGAGPQQFFLVFYMYL